MKSKKRVLSRQSSVEHMGTNTVVEAFRQNRPLPRATGNVIGILACIKCQEAQSAVRGKRPAEDEESAAYGYAIATCQGIKLSTVTASVVTLRKAGILEGVWEGSNVRYDGRPPAMRNILTELGGMLTADLTPNCPKYPDLQSDC